MQHRQGGALRVQVKENGMATLERGSGYDQYQAAGIAIARSVIRAACYLVRMVIFGPLAVLEPVINRVLSVGCFLGLLCCLIFKLEDPAGVHHLHYGLTLGFSIGCAVLLTLYYMLMRTIAP
jgi:hypothetical protein